MKKCPDCTLPVLANAPKGGASLRSEEFCIFCNHRLTVTGRASIEAEQVGPRSMPQVRPAIRKITFDIPKGSQLQSVARCYVVTRLEKRGVKIARLKDVTITAEYEVVEARP